MVHVCHPVRMGYWIWGMGVQGTGHLIWGMRYGVLGEGGSWLSNIHTKGVWGHGGMAAWGHGAMGL